MVYNTAQGRNSQFRHKRAQHYPSFFSFIQERASHIRSSLIQSRPPAFQSRADSPLTALYLAVLIDQHLTLLQQRWFRKNQTQVFLMLNPTALSWHFSFQALLLLGSLKRSHSIHWHLRRRKKKKNLQLTQWHIITLDIILQHDSDL